MFHFDIFLGKSSDLTKQVKLTHLSVFSFCPYSGTLDFKVTHLTHLRCVTLMHLGKLHDPSKYVRLTLLLDKMCHVTYFSVSQ